MFDFFKETVRREKHQEYAPLRQIRGENKQLSCNLQENMIQIRKLFENSADLVERRILLGDTEAAILICEGMVGLSMYAELLAEPLTSSQAAKISGADEALDFFRLHTLMGADQKEFYTYGELFTFIMSGFAVILVEGKSIGIACGMQGFSFRSVSEPSSEINVRGSREGFVEPLRINMTLIRRRIKSPSLK